jgi:lipopolysaccharide biosynthesis glycosyltransferase
MNVITALNKRYIPYTAVMLSSLGMNENEHVDAYLLNSELSDVDIDLIAQALKNYDMTIHSVEVEAEKFSNRLPHNSQWSMETYYRLMMLELLPKELDRALYLDGDMIINKSLKELYYMDFDDKEIIACDDKSGLNFPDNYGMKQQEMFKEAFSQGYRYFNAGVMLLNIRLLREKNSFQTYLDAIEEWKYEMEAPDQDILNWVHWKNVGYADYQRYDMFARVAHNAEITYEEIKQGVAIIHYAGEKPWENCNFHFDIEKLWWDYAKETPFYENLLNDFVDSSLRDKTVEMYLKDLIDTVDNQKQVFRQIQKILNNVLGNR